MPLQKQKIVKKGTKMKLGWVDYSRQERETIKELLKVLGESSSLDELGVGIVRDSISDLLYPGTSVLHTRAKYYILIPELFKKAIKSGLTTRNAVRKKIDEYQDKIARALRRTIDEETGIKAVGIIGGRSDHSVKMKPTRIYWNALRVTGILCDPTLSYDDACGVVAGYNRKRQNIELKIGSEDGNNDSQELLRENLILFNAPCKQTIEEYLENPTLYLSKDEAIYLKEQFLCMPIMKDTLMEYCLKKNHTFVGQTLDSIVELPNMSTELRNRLMLAKEFANFIYGAYIVYNLVFWENGGDDATKDVKENIKTRYNIWKRTNIGLPHREEILNLVKDHEHYKVALRDFLIKFETAVNANTSDICSDEEKIIVKERERFCKREKSKLGRDDPFREIQTTPMSYRHETGQTILSDILKGLVRENG